MKIKGFVDKFLAGASGGLDGSKLKFKQLFAGTAQAKPVQPSVSVTSSVPIPRGPAAAVSDQEDRLRTVAKTAADLQRVAADFNSQANAAVEGMAGPVDDAAILRLLELDEAAEKADVHADSSIKHLFNVTGRLYSLQQKADKAVSDAESEAELVLTEFEHLTEQKYHSGETAQQMVERFRKTLEQALQVSNKFHEDEKTQSYNAEEIGSHIQRFSAGKSVMEIPAGQMDRESAVIRGFSQAGLNAALRTKHGALSVDSMLREQTDLPNRMVMVINEMELPSNTLSRVYAILNHLVELEQSGKLGHLGEELKEVVSRAIAAGRRARRAAVEQATLVQEEISTVETIVKDSDRLVTLWKRVNGLIDANFVGNYGLKIKEEVSGELINLMHDIISTISAMRNSDVILENVKARYVKDVDPAVESLVQAILNIEKFLSKQSLPEIKRSLALSTKRSANAGSKKTLSQGKQAGLSMEQRAIMDQIRQSLGAIAGINVQIADRNAQIRQMTDPAKRGDAVRGTRKLRADKAGHQNRIIDFTLKLSGLQE